MKLQIYPTKNAMGAAAAAAIAGSIAQAIAQRGQANVIFATGMSQFEMLESLVQQPIEWSKVTGFHLDEYVGLATTHPASFRTYLQERLLDKVAPMQQFYFVDGEQPDPAAECRRLNEIIRGYTIDVACVGIGENGHLAFNDPPADFDTEDPFIVVNLDEACRKQQLGEGWFATFEDVPQQAISMSIQQIMRSRHIVCTVPDQRKAEAVASTVDGPVFNQAPASILQRHAQCALYLDEAAAALLSAKHRV